MDHSPWDCKELDMTKASEHNSTTFKNVSTWKSLHMLERQIFHKLNVLEYNVIRNNSNLIHVYPSW